MNISIVDTDSGHISVRYYLLSFLEPCIFSSTRMGTNSMNQNYLFSENEIQNAIHSAITAKSKFSDEKCDAFDISKEFDNVRNILSKRVQEIRSSV